MTSRVVFIDSRLPDQATLIAGLPADTEWHLINADENGLAQMAAILANVRDLAAIDILSHGSAGQLLLGNSSIDAASLDTHAAQLAQIGQSLASTGDLLLYGCEVGAGETGLNFIGKLAQATGADVAASTDLTGAANLGGDWVLEAVSGTSESAALQVTDWAQALAISSLSPADDATNVAAGITPLVMTTTSAVEFLWSGSPAFYLYKDNSLIETFTWPSGTHVFSGTGSQGGTISAPGSSATPPGKTITITPGAALVAGSSYYVTSTPQAYWDYGGIGSAGITSATTWNFTVAAPVSPAAPVLDATKSPTLGSIAANLAAPSNGSTTGSVLVSDLIEATGGGGLNNYTDANSDPAGIAITGVNSNGTLYYSTNGGTNWTQLTGTVSASSALLLAADADNRIYFKPNANYSGNLSNAITFKAWDQTGGYTDGQTGVTTSAGVTRLGGYDTSGSAYGVAISGNYAYVADYGKGLQVINISTPASPILAGTYDTSGSAFGVALSGDYAYVADGSSGLQVIDISTPASPTLAGTYNTPGVAWGVAVSGNYAYVADGSSGLQVIDISTPASPTLAGTYNTSGSAYGVAVSGNYAYVADYSSGLQVINISNPASPTFAGNYNTPGAARGVAISGNYAYVADESSGLQVIDISTPASPTWVGAYNTSGYAFGVALSGNNAYVADYISGLKVIDISTPASPTLAGTYDTSGFAYGVALSGNNAYVADGNSGLQVLSYANPVSFSSATDTVSLSVVANTAPSATAATISYTDTSVADALTNATGTLAFTDAENNSFTLSLTGGSNASHTVGGVTYDKSVLGKYGTLYFETATGKYHYEQNDAAINALKATNVSETFTVTATDNGSPVATGQSTIKVNITGANDAPVLSAPTAIGITDTAAADTQAALIKSASHNSGTLAATDAENGNITYGITDGATGGNTAVNGITYDVSKAGTNGTLYVQSSTGAYVFVPSASVVNALVAGNTDETFTVTASDGSASANQTLTINYTGANDTPVQTSSNPPVALHYVDTSAADVFSNQTGTLAGTDAEGAVTYGINGGATGGSTVVDTVTYDVSLAGTYGTLYLKSSDGGYVYVPNAGAINALAATNKTDPFTLTLTDAASDVISTVLDVKLVGADDVPVVDKVRLKLFDSSVADTFSNQTGTLSAADVDSSGATNTTLIYGIDTGTTGGSTDIGGTTYDVSKAGTYGTLYVKSSNGAYVYVPNTSAINARSADDTDSFTITASDGASTPGVGSNSFTVYLSASNDVPVLTAPTALNLTDTSSTDTFSNQTGTLSASDAEGTGLTYGLWGATTQNNDIGGVTYTHYLTGNYGTLYLKSDDGQYVYVPDASKINALTEAAKDKFSVTASDGSYTDTQALFISLTGANDAPVLSAVNSLSYTDTTDNDIFQSQGGQLVGSDADNSASLTYGISGGTSGSTTIGTLEYNVSKVGTYGTLYLQSSTGAYLYVPSAAMESQKSGTPTDTFTMTLTDGVVANPVEQTLTVNLTAADDPNRVSGDSTGSITEDDTSPATGRLLIEDRDTADTVITAQTNTAGTYGTFSVDASGNWSYTIDNTKAATQALASGASQTDTFAVVANGVSNNVVITVNGSNDAPVITSNGGGATASVSVAENSTAVTTVTATDVDAADTRSYSITGGADQAKFQIDSSTGVLSFIAAPDFESPQDQGDTVSNNTYVLEVTASDTALGSVMQILTVTVTDVNENSPAPSNPTTTTMVDGATVTTSTTTTNEGQTVDVLTISPVVPGRTESIGNASTADVPLFFGNASSTIPATTASLPTGIGLTSTGARTPTNNSEALVNLVSLVNRTADTTENNRLDMVSGSQSFLDRLDQQADKGPLIINSIKLTVASGQPTAPNAPIVITGSTSPVSQGNVNGGAPVEAIVIDTRALPPGTVLELKDIEFAVIVGDNVTVRGGQGSNIVFAGSGPQNIVLGADDDELYGGDGDDVIGSEGGDDRLFGNAGDDTLFGGAGNDLLHGGVGSDVAIYSGSIKQYEIVRDHGKTIVRSVTHSDDVDTVVNVETLRFDDSTYHIENPVEFTWIATLYEEVLGRQAELDGFQYWAAKHEAGLGIGAIALSFLHSAEYNTGASQQFAELPASEQLNLLYEHFLGRAADVPGHAYWMEHMGSGMNINDVAQHFVLSNEMQGSYVRDTGWEFFV